MGVLVAFLRKRGHNFLLRSGGIRYHDVIKNRTTIKLNRMKNAIQSRQVTVPLQYILAQRLPPFVPELEKRVEDIRYPEDWYLKKYYQKDPDAHQRLVRFNSFDAPHSASVARRAAQIAFEAQVPRDAAFNYAMEELPSPDLYKKSDEMLHQKPTIKRIQQQEVDYVIKHYTD